MPTKGLWDGFIMLSILMVLIFAGTLSVANPKPAPQTSYPGWLVSIFEGTELQATGRNLQKAVEEGNFDNVKDLVARGADVDYSLGGPITTAARNGHFEVVKYLLEAGANPNGTNEVRVFLGRPIEVAGRNNHVNIINLLLDAGATVTTEKYGVGVLNGAAENGHLEAVQTLLDAGADPNFTYGISFDLAAKGGHVDVIKAFLKAGADVNAGGVLSTAAEKGHLEVVKTLIEAGVTNGTLSAALLKAAETDRVDIIKLLIEKGADHNSGYFLSRAAARGGLQVVRILLEAGSVIKYGEDSIPPLHYAASFGRADVIALLVEYGGDINKALDKDYSSSFEVPVVEIKKGWTPMHVAAGFGHLITQQLLDLGADISTQDNLGRTPLQVAIHFEKLMTTKELLRFCGNVTIANKEGKKALDMAKDVALRNATDTSKYQVLMNILQEVMPEEIATTPFNKVATDALTKEFLAMLETNSTLNETVKDVYAYYIEDSISIALSHLFEKRARRDMVKIFEDHKCKAFMQEQKDVVDLGLDFLAKCECVPGEGPKIIFIPIHECVPVSPVRNKERPSELLKPEKSIEIPAETMT